MSVSNHEISTSARRKSGGSNPATAATELKDRADVKALTAETEQLATVAISYTIKTADEYTAGALELQKIKGAQQRLEAMQKSITQPLEKAKKAAIALFKPYVSKLESAETTIKTALLAYDEEQDCIRREEQAKADEAARKQQNKLHQQAAKAIASGKVEKADQLANRAAAVVPVVIQREAPKVDGISKRDNWKSEVVDLRALVKAVAEGRAPLSYLQGNDKVLGEQAKSLKQDFVCDGVRVWNDKILAAGAA